MTVIGSDGNGFRMQGVRSGALGTLSLLVAATLWPTGATAAMPAGERASTLTVSILRNADTAGNSPCLAIARLWLADEETQQVVLTVYGEQPWEIISTNFTRESAHDWFADIGASTLAQLKSVASGQWQIETFGSSPCSADFTLNLSNLSESDLPATPSITSPAAFATDVPRDVAFSWSNPWSPGLPDRLEIFEHSANGCGPSITQRLSSVEGSISLGATAWQPAALLGPAANLFRVTTSRFALPSQAGASPIKNQSGSIVWGVPPGAPGGHRAGTPLVLLGSQRSITFEVQAPVPGDLNGDGVVDGNDLGTLLGNWGGGG